MKSRFWLLSLAVVLHPRLSYGERKCRCGPEENCWPSTEKWDQLNKTANGRLIHNVPIARSCYPGSHLDQIECAAVTSNWADQSFQSSIPIGRSYPYNITCAPVDYGVGQVPTSCTIGISPRYAINATSVDHIRAGIKFAKNQNIRLVITSTGHDLLGRSDGYGSLEIWLRYYRTQILYQKKYISANSCQSQWTGAAVKVDGAYQWKDVYQVAKQNNVIVVGGGSPGPGAIGGWPAGGGHGPATRNYGLGSDQILEAQVLLASGEIVTANACENSDLYRSLRGGGPGYGIVLRETIKAYPNVKVVAVHHLDISPFQKTANNSVLLDAITAMMQAYPDLNDAGYAGYAYWFRNYPIVFAGNATSGYRHGFWTIGKSQAQAQKAFAPVKAKLARFEKQLNITETYTLYNDYWSFYEAESGVYDPVGDTSILTSRLIDRKAVADVNQVRQAVEVTGGKPDEVVSNVVELVSGGKVFRNADNKFSGVHPAWRKSYFVSLVGTGVAKNASKELRRSTMNDITFVKGAALKKLAPGTGGYMNEGDRNDPDYIATFYGANYPSHLAVKRRYDPQNLFFCPSCVGSEDYFDAPDGPLCKK